MDPGKSSTEQKGEKSRDCHIGVSVIRPVHSPGGSQGEVQGGRAQEAELLEQNENCETCLR